VLFTFPSRYSCTIGHQGVFRLGGWSPHVQTGFHVPRPTQGPHQALRIRGYHPLRPTFPGRSACLDEATGLLRVRSPLLAESLLMSFPPGTEMFQFPGFASRSYVFRSRSSLLRGLPHSDIHGSTPARGSPWLFAACHVLHRLLVPRHPPNALLALETPLHAQEPATPAPVNTHGFIRTHTTHFASLSANPAILDASDRPNERSSTGQTNPDHGTPRNAPTIFTCPMNTTTPS
jgi:hypothetical protein